MNIEDVQPWLAGLLADSEDLEGVTILVDDGTYPKTPGREDALRRSGLVLVVWQVESGGLIDGHPNGAAIESLNLAVVIEENVAVSRGGGGGLGISAEKALRLVREALVGAKRSGEPGTVLRSDDPPFHNFGNQNGVQRIVVLLALDLSILPV